LCFQYYEFATILLAPPFPAELASFLARLQNVRLIRHLSD
jgi:hypothetical protein